LFPILSDFFTTPSGTREFQGHCAQSQDQNPGGGVRFYWPPLESDDLGWIRHASSKPRKTNRNFGQPVASAGSGMNLTIYDGVFGARTHRAITGRWSLSLSRRRGGT